MSAGAYAGLHQTDNQARPKPLSFSKPMTIFGV